MRSLEETLGKSLGEIIFKSLWSLALILNFRSKLKSLTELELAFRELILVGTGGIEPPTSSMSRKRSPTELRAFIKVG